MKKLKALTEKRAGLINEMEQLMTTAETEVRALTEEEKTTWESLKSQVEALDETISALEEMENLKNSNNSNNTNSNGDNETVEQKEERAFKDLILGNITEKRAGEITFTDNGAMIPKTILDKIVQRVRDICPIFDKASRYYVKGNLNIIFVSADSDEINMAYAEEFTELTAKKKNFGSIELTGYLAGVLTLVSKKLVNNTNFDIVAEVINLMADDIAAFVERECLLGTTSKADGLSKVKLNVEAKSETQVTPDELIELKDKVKDKYQKDSIWIMSPNTRTAIRKLKDGNGRFIYDPNSNLLHEKEVYVSDNMPDMEQGKVAIYYGDMSGLSVKISEDSSIQVLLEKFATQHAIGINSWIEFDAKLSNEQKIAKLTMKGE